MSASNKNCTLATRLSYQHFSERTQPQKKAFPRNPPRRSSQLDGTLFSKFQKATGSLQRKKLKISSFLNQLQGYKEKYYLISRIGLKTFRRIREGFAGET